MRTRKLATILIDFLPIPGGATLVNVLYEVSDLCKDVGEATKSCKQLHKRLDGIYYELERMDQAGGLRSKPIDTFTRTLEQYWRELDAFKNRNVVQRLLHHGKFKKAMAQINEDVDNLVEIVGFATARFQVQWRQQYDEDMRRQQEALEGLLRDASELRSELRDVNDKRDALILLHANSQKINHGQSSLPVETQTAVQQAYQTAIRLSNGSVDELPSWFMDENDIEFDIVPFAHGSYATVHRGTLKQHTRVVVKMVRSTEGGLDAALQPSFIQEANIWSKLQHPHVVRLLGACHVSRRPFLVCEEAANGNMKDFLAASPSHGQLTWELLYEAAQGIAHLHSKEIIHGDIRLSNILVSSERKALVMDFGLSRIKRSSKTKSMTKRSDGVPVQGNWRWMAPECFTHLPQYESDVYGLAMTILEAYVGEPPYADVRGEKDVKDKVTAGELPKRPTGMSDRVWTLIENMTKKERTERMKIEDVVNTLKVLAATEPAPSAKVVETGSQNASTSSPSSEVIQRVLVDLNEETSAIAAAKQLHSLTAHPNDVKPFCSAASVHVLICSLQDSTTAEVKEPLTLALANIAKDITGAQLIGARGGIMPLVQLFSTGDDRVKRSALEALVPLVKNPLNGMMFIQCGGVEALQSHLERGSLTETLKLVKDLALGSADLTRTIAGNPNIVRNCLSLMTTTNPDERHAAGVLLRALVQSDTSAVRALDQLQGFDSLMKLAKIQNQHAEETLLAAIKTLLRAENEEADKETQTRTARGA